MGITGIYSRVGGRGEPAERGELTAEEAAGMICAKCELGFTLDLVSLHCFIVGSFCILVSRILMQCRCLLSKELPYAMHMVSSLMNLLSISGGSLERRPLCLVEVFMMVCKPSMYAVAVNSTLLLFFEILLMSWWRFFLYAVCKDCRYHYLGTGFNSSQ